MRNQIIFADGTAFDLPVQQVSPIMPLKADRQYRCISVEGLCADVVAAFTDGATYRHEWESLSATTVVDPETGEETEQTVTAVETEDLSDWAIASDVIDKRNGVCIAVMGKPTEQELLQAALDELVLSELGGIE